MNAKLIFRHGHSYWETANGIAVADRSMRHEGHPESTDDGLLLLDEERLLRSEEYYQVVGSYSPCICFRSCCSQSVPLRTLDGKKYMTPASADEFVKLCWTIHKRRAA